MRVFSKFRTRFLNWQYPIMLISQLQPPGHPLLQPTPPTLPSNPPTRGLLPGGSIYHNSPFSGYGSSSFSTPSLHSHPGLIGRHSLDLLWSRQLREPLFLVSIQASNKPSPATYYISSHGYYKYHHPHYTKWWANKNAHWQPFFVYGIVRFLGVKLLS